MQSGSRTLSYIFKKSLCPTLKSFGSISFGWDKNRQCPTIWDKPLKTDKALSGLVLAWVWQKFQPQPKVADGVVEKAGDWGIPPKMFFCVIFALFKEQKILSLYILGTSMYQDWIRTFESKKNVLLKNLIIFFLH